MPDVFTFAAVYILMNNSITQKFLLTSDKTVNFIVTVLSGYLHE